MSNYFDQIYGNADSIAYFTAAIRGGRLSHAYILEGPSGSGRKTLAKAIAATRVKDSPFAHKIVRDQSPDLLLFGIPEKKKTIGVDTVRALKSEVYVKPNELDAKFFIITDCQAMTPQAQNAALKILEEPPKNVYFFLCTDSAAALLPTVRSRAQTVRMQSFTEGELELYAKRDPRLQSLAASDPERLRLLIRQAGGCIGRLQSQTEDKEFVRIRTSAQALISLLNREEYLPLLLHCRSLSESRSELDAILQRTAEGLRDVLACRAGSCQTLLLFDDCEEALDAARRLSDRSILLTANEIEKQRMQLASNPNLKGVLALLADKLYRALQK